MRTHILCVLPAMYAVATSSLEDSAALLAGGPGVVIVDRASAEIAHVISRTGGIGIVDALRHDRPRAQGFE